MLDIDAADVVVRTEPKSKRPLRCTDVYRFVAMQEVVDAAEAAWRLDFENHPANQRLGLALINVRRDSK
jgi:hypothetical protein